MIEVLAAVDGSPATGPVIRAARVLAGVLLTGVRAVHVSGDVPDISDLVAAEGVPLTILGGEPVAALTGAAAHPDVVALVVGARRLRGGAHPVGSTALALVERVARPVVVVPPDARVVEPGGLRRVLVPLDGTKAASSAVATTVEAFCGSGVSVAVLHVFDAATVPMFWDPSAHGERAWGREFLARYCDQPGVELRLRTGVPGPAILDEAATVGVDTIVLGWSRDLAGGHAATVREVLGRSPVPVVLLPVTYVPPDGWAEQLLAERRRMSASHRA